MARKNYNLIHSALQSIAASRPGAWFFARTIHHFDAIFLRLSGGRLTMTGFCTGLPVVIVTATGARSGLPRTLPLLCVYDELDLTTFALIGTNFGRQHYPVWYFNLKANPCATCSIDGQTGQYVAHEATNEEYARFWQYAADIYRGYPLYKQRKHGRNVPIMVMSPQ